MSLPNSSESPELCQAAEQVCKLAIELLSFGNDANARLAVRKYMPLCSPAFRVGCEAKLAFEAEDKVACIKLIDQWVEMFISAHPSTPNSEQFDEFLSHFEWLGIDSEEESVAESALLKRFRQHWPHTAATLTLAHIVEGYEDAEEAIEKLQFILNMSPDFWPARRQLCQVLENERRFELASGEFKRLSDAGVIGTREKVDLQAWAYVAAMAGELDVAKASLQRYLDFDPEDDDAKNSLANVLFRSGEESEALRLWLTLIPELSERQLWLWVTKGEYYLEDDGSEREELEPFNYFGTIEWSCHADTQAGDFIFLYRTRPKMDIAYLLMATEDAEEAEEDDEWSHMCQCRVLLKLDVPVTLEAMRKSEALENWGALRRQFQGTAFKLDRRIFSELLRLAAEADSKLDRFADAILRTVPV